MATPDLSTKTARKRVGTSDSFTWRKVARGRAVGYRRRNGDVGPVVRAGLRREGTARPM